MGHFAKMVKKENPYLPPRQFGLYTGEYMGVPEYGEGEKTEENYHKIADLAWLFHELGIEQREEYLLLNDPISASRKSREENVAWYEHETGTKIHVLTQTLAEKLECDPLEDAEYQVRHDVLCWDYRDDPGEMWEKYEMDNSHIDYAFLHAQEELIREIDIFLLITEERKESDRARSQSEREAFRAWLARKAGCRLYNLTADNAA